MSCNHENFHATVAVARLQSDHGGPVTHYSAGVKIVCADCQVEFQFAGVESGMSMYEPMCSIDGAEIHLPIMPLGHIVPEGLPGYRVKAALPGGVG